MTNAIIAAERREWYVQSARVTETFETLAPDSIEYLLFEGTGSYARGEADETALLRWIRGAVEHHLEHSITFRRLAAASGFMGSHLRSIDDVSRIPLLSSGTFKRGTLISTQASSMKLCTSSGTLGTKSIVPRDSLTLERYAGGILHGMREFLEDRERRKAFVLGPPPEEAGDLWFSYSLSLAEVLNDTEFFVRGEQLRQAALYEALASLERGLQPVIVGPPSLIVDFLDWLAREQRRLEMPNAFLLTAGGWKLRANESVDRATLNGRVHAQLGIPAEQQRDIFNMVELNTVIFECERQRKHVPPWLHVSARSSSDLMPVPDEECGILAYLDPTASSYPGFVLSDDLGRVSSEPCECGRAGQVMSIARRLESIEARGCGLKMRSYAGR